MSRRSRERAVSSDMPSPPLASDVLATVERSIDAAWNEERAVHGGEDDVATATRIVADPSRHPWRLVDAAFDRMRCGDCGGRLSSGPVGCAACDLAHGYRFAAREPDRPGMPAGNEHAIRVSTAVLRAPHRYPSWAVEANRVHLPLFLAGEMPTRAEQEAMLRAAQAGVRVDATGIRTFRELATRAAAAAARRS